MIDRSTFDEFVRDYANRADCDFDTAMFDIGESQLGADMLAERQWSMDQYHGAREEHYGSIPDGLTHEERLEYIQLFLAPTIVLVLADQSEIDVPAEFGSWNISRRCRWLANEGLTVNQISHGLGIRYQQVRQAVMGSKPVPAPHGRCAVCGRPLRSQKSIDSGIGPVCAAHSAPGKDRNSGIIDDTDGTFYDDDEDAYFRQKDARMRDKFGLDDR